MGAYDYPAENEQVKDGLTISYRHEGPRAVVRLGGDLDMYASSRLHRELEDILRSPAEALEIDAAALEFIDSAGLRTVLRARSEAQTRTMEFQGWR